MWYWFGTQARGEGSLGALGRKGTPIVDLWVCLGRKHPPSIYWVTPDQV